MQSKAFRSGSLCSHGAAESTTCSSDMGILELIFGALTSEVFWGINLACMLVMAYPVAYVTLIFLAEGTWLKPILLVGLYTQVVFGAVVAAFKEYSTRSDIK